MNDPAENGNQRGGVVSDTETIIGHHHHGERRGRRRDGNAVFVGGEVEDSVQRQQQQVVHDQDHDNDDTDGNVNNIDQEEVNYRVLYRRRSEGQLHDQDNDDNLLADEEIDNEDPSRYNQPPLHNSFPAQYQSFHQQNEEMYYNQYQQFPPAQGSAWQVSSGSPSFSGPPLPPLPPGHPGLLQYYEAQMRDHAAAYANAAAAAAMAAAQIAAGISASNNPNFMASNGFPPGGFVSNNSANHDVPLHLQHHPSQQVIPSNMMFPTIGPPVHFNQPHVHPPAYSTQICNGPFEAIASSNPSWEQNYLEHQQEEQVDISHKNYYSDVNSKSSRRRKRGQGGAANYPKNRHIDPNVNSAQSRGSAFLDMDSNKSSSSNANECLVKRGRQRRRRRLCNDAGSSDTDPSLSSSSFPNKSTPNNRRRNRRMAMAASSSSDGGSASWIASKRQRQHNDENLLGKSVVAALYEWCDKRRTKPVFSDGGIMTKAEQQPSQDGGYYLEKMESLARESLNARTVDDFISQAQEDADGDNTGQNRIQQRLERPSAFEDGSKQRRTNKEKMLFEVIVTIDGFEMGRALGLSKNAAKKKASRQVLQLVLPGIQFDEQFETVIGLPETIKTMNKRNSRRQQLAAQVGRSNAAGMRTQHNSTASCLEDLAPNLAKQLAIGKSNDDDDIEDKCQDRTANDRGPLYRNFSRRQQYSHRYTGASTTSEDEDEKCIFSSLLFTSAQIDERVIEPPWFTYKILESDEMSQSKRKAGVSERTYQASNTLSCRSPYKSIGFLKIRMSSDIGSSAGHQLETSFHPQEAYQLLKAVGVGTCKREAKHMAAANLLAKLFPDCIGLEEVKEAAIAAHERYVSLRQQSKEEKVASKLQGQNCMSKPKDKNTSCFPCDFPAEDVPRIPAAMEARILSAVGALIDSQSLDGVNGGDGAVGVAGLDEPCLMRQHSRQQQLEEKIDSALQKLNEHDEEGRSLPEKLTEDDVGRTVLRRASSDDMCWIETFFARSLESGTIDQSPLSLLLSGKEPSSTTLWSSSTVVLLLCRAIAPHEDPPLGCAVCTLGFSMDHGKVLRLVEIASKPHLPRERFMECLLSFADCMDCFLEITSESMSPLTIKTLRKDCLSEMIMSHFTHSKNASQEISNSKYGKLMIQVHEKMSRSFEETLVQHSLQSVQEEDGEGVEDSDSSLRDDEKEKGRDKPSKRSRFE